MHYIDQTPNQQSLTDHSILRIFHILRNEERQHSKHERLVCESRWSWIRCVLLLKFLRQSLQEIKYSPSNSQIHTYHNGRGLFNELKWVLFYICINSSLPRNHGLVQITSPPRKRISNTSINSKNWMWQHKNCLFLCQWDIHIKRQNYKCQHAGILILQA